MTRTEVPTLIRATGEVFDGFDLDEVMALQRSLLAVEPTRAAGAAGFLIGQWTRDDLTSVLREGGVLSVVSDPSGVVAFALATACDGPHGLIDGRYAPAATLERPVDFGGLRYVAQVGVKASARRRGFAGMLVRDICASSPEGVVADVVVEPVSNEASLAFFRGLGFCRVGRLSVARYPGFGPHTSEVLLWTAPTR